MVMRCMIPVRIFSLSYRFRDAMLRSACYRTQPQLRESLLPVRILHPWITLVKASLSCSCAVVVVR
jgi:hypothetical protein